MTSGNGPADQRTPLAAWWARAVFVLLVRPERAGQEPSVTDGCGSEGSVSGD